MIIINIMLVSINDHSYACGHAEKMLRKMVRGFQQVDTASTKGESIKTGAVQDVWESNGTYNCHSVNTSDQQDIDRLSYSHIFIEPF